MLTLNETPYRQPLTDQLILSTAADERDVDRVAAFTDTIEGPTVAALTRNLFLHHPATRGRDLFFVAERDTGRVVSSLCLIPWTLHIAQVDIPAGEMGIVATAEPYRRRGLIRAQVDAFKRRLHERGCLLSHIQGIPYFYRQFGYEYALPLEPGLRLELRQVPAAPVPSFTFRRAGVDDLPSLSRLYDRAVRDLAIHTVRGEQTWRYLQTHADGTITERERWLVETPGGAVVGYLSVQRYPFGDELCVDETSGLSFDAALAALQHLKTLVVQRDKPGIRLNLPESATLVRLARSLGAHDLGTYAWQIHLPDRLALLQAIAPAIEDRVAHSPFAGLTRHFLLDLYRERLTLQFHQGRLTSLARVDAVPPDAHTILRCPPLQLTPLILGHRTWRDLHAAHPDVTVPPTWRLLVDTLFPPLTAFLYSPY